jgi:hypothetical protein
MIKFEGKWSQDERKKEKKTDKKDEKKEEKKNRRGRRWTVGIGIIRGGV